MPKTRFSFSQGFAKSVIIQIAGIAIVLAVLAIISQLNYLIFHSIVEIATIAIAISIFVIVWNARDKIDNGYFIVVGLAILFIGVIDLAHTLAFKGMGVFPGNSSDLPTQLWIAARYLQAFTLLAAPLMAGRRVRTAPVLAIFSAATVFLLWTIYVGIFPSCFVEGRGLTPFKIASEYVISLILVAATALLYWKRAAFDPRVFWLLVTSNILSIGAELAFTAYVSVYGFMNMLGHLFRLVATYCMYLAIVAIGIREPYKLLWRNMNTSERQYRELFTEMTNGYALHEIIVDATGTPVDYRFLKVNPAFERMTGLSAKDIEGKTAREVLPGLEQHWIETYGKVVLTKTPARFVNRSLEFGKWFEVYAFSPAPGKFATIFNDVTDRKLAEEEGARLSAIVEYSDEAIIGKTLDGIITSWNAGAERMYGYSAQEMIGKSVSLLVPPDHPDDTVTILERVKNGEPLIHYETLCRKNDGGLITVTLTASPIRDTQNHLIGISIIGHDITERKRAEEELWESNEKIRVLLDSAAEAIYGLDMNGNCTFCNISCLRLLGYKHTDELLGKNMHWQIHAKHPDGTHFPVEECRIFQAFNKGEGTHVDDEVLWRSDGTSFPAEYWSYPQLRRGVVVGAVVTFVDITERKRAEKELLQLADRLALATRAGGVGIWDYDVVNNTLNWDDQMFALYGITRKQFSGAYDAWQTGLHPEDKQRGDDEIQMALRGEKEFDTEFRVLWPDGSIHYIRALAIVQRDATGKPLRMIGTNWDITAQKTAEENIKQQASLIKSLLDSVPDIIFFKDTEGVYMGCNPPFAEFVGKSSEEIIGKTDYDLFNKEIADFFREHDKHMLELGEPRHNDEWITYPNGRKILIDTLKTPYWGPDGTLIGVLGISRDITERKRIEEALRQANKQLNLLSSITRHDILNQLMALKGYLYLSKEMIDKPTVLTGYIQKEEQAANTIEHQIKFTKDYQELGVAAPEWQNVNASIKKAVAGLPMRDVHVEVDPDNPTIFTDKLFEKVFYNLIDNALRYGGADMKTIRVSSQEIDSGLKIICEDDGVGITGEDKKRLFTKGFGKNTGLGLFLSREILAITGITITENGTPGKGARFEITVPKGMWRMNGVRA